MPSTNVRPHPTQEELMAAFEDKGTHLIWKIRRQGVRQFSKAGSLSGDGYWQIWFNGENWKAHRLMWILRHGPIPEGMEVDHRNGNPLDNEDSNHRLGTRVQNGSNLKMHPGNKSGVRGVIRTASGRWNAYIKHNHHGYNLGTYDTIEEAAAARKAAELKLHGNFTGRDF